MYGFSQGHEAEAYDLKVRIISLRSLSLCRSADYETTAGFVDELQAVCTQND